MDDDVPYLLLTPGPLTTTPHGQAGDAARRVDLGSRLQRHCAGRAGTAGATGNGGQSGGRSGLHGRADARRVAHSPSRPRWARIIPRDGKLLVVNNGAYGQRMAEIAKRAWH